MGWGVCVEAKRVTYLDEVEEARHGLGRGGLLLHVLGELDLLVQHEERGHAQVALSQQRHARLRRGRVLHHHEVQRPACRGHRDVVPEDQGQGEGEGQC